MAKSYGNTLNFVEDDEQDYSEMEDSEFEDVNSDDSEEVPTYMDDLNEAKSKLSNLSIKTRLISSDKIGDDDDDDVSIIEEMSAPKLGIKDMKDFEEIQRIVDCGQVEKLKVEQCKIYLRKNGLRLTGKKDTLIQRIKEHLEILNGGGERKFPQSSFVLNCKGDACMGDVVMFEQTVYEGYNVASRSAIGPPCGKRLVVGRIVKESYGAAKQQHTFTVEVLWSKGYKSLPPLHPLLIKGRNLYKLNTLRQRWEDESERQRVLSEKHSRGSIARSNRESRIQEKTSKKTLKSSSRVCPKGQSSHQQKNHKCTTDHVSLHSKYLGSKSQKQQTYPAELKKNSSTGLLQPPQQNKENIAAASRVCLANKDKCCGFSDKFLHPRQPRNFEHKENSVRPVLIPQMFQQNPASYHNNSIVPPILEHNRPAESTLGSHFGFSDKFLHPRQPRHFEYEENYVRPVLIPQMFQQKPASYHSENGNLLTSVNWLVDSNRTTLHTSYGRNHQKEQQQPCRFYPQGKCYYGNRCRFLHEAIGTNVEFT